MFSSSYCFPPLSFSETLSPGMVSIPTRSLFFSYHSFSFLPFFFPSFALLFSPPIFFVFFFISSPFCFFSFSLFSLYFILLISSSFPLLSLSLFFPLSPLNFFLVSPLCQGGCFEHKGYNNKRLVFPNIFSHLLALMPALHLPTTVSKNPGENTDYYTSWELFIRYYTCLVRLIIFQLKLV